MYRARSKRKQAIRTAIVFSVMTTLVVVGLVVTVLYVMGYRFDTKQQTLSQGGIIQTESRPSRAQISMDGQRISGSTPRQIYADPGTHIVSMSREGYRPWQKTVSIEPGGVLWLNYALLVPTNPVATELRALAKIDAALPQPREDRALIMESRTEPTFQLVNLADDGRSTELKLPDDIAPTESGRYVMHSWSTNGRAVLIEHRSSESSRWYVLDVRDAARSTDVSSIVGSGLQLRNLTFMAGSDRIIYALSGNTVRRIDISERTLSAPLIEQVSSYTQGPDGIITYVSEYDVETKSRSMGYMTRGTDTPREVFNIHGEPRDTVMFAVGEYQGKQYAARQINDSLIVNRITLRPSDGNQPLDMRIVANLTTDETASHLSFSPHNRFVLAQHDDTFMTYDIELDRFTTTTLRGTEKITAQLQWLDNYHLWSIRDGQLRMYEFDGENVQLFSGQNAGLTPQLSKNAESIYAYHKKANGQVTIERISLRVR